MHKRIAQVFAVIIIALSFAISPSPFRAATSNRQADVFKTSQGELRITPLYHGSVMLEFGGKVIHVDPWSQGTTPESPKRI